MKLQSLIMYSFSWSIYTVINSVTDLECVNVPGTVNKSMQLGFSFPFHFKVPYRPTVKHGSPEFQRGILNTLFVGRERFYCNSNVF